MSVVLSFLFPFFQFAAPWEEVGCELPSLPHSPCPLPHKWTEHSFETLQAGKQDRRRRRGWELKLTDPYLCPHLFPSQKKTAELSSSNFLKLYLPFNIPAQPLDIQTAPASWDPDSVSFTPSWLGKRCGPQILFTYRMFSLPGKPAEPLLRK